MTGDSGVEIIVKKRPSLSIPPIKAPSMPTVSSSTAKTGGKALKILIVTLIMIGIGFGIYKAYPTMSSFVFAGFGEEFDYTVTAKATETFSTEGTEKIEFSLKTGSKTEKLTCEETDVNVYVQKGDNLDLMESFTASKGDTITLDFTYFSIDGGGKVKAYKNGNIVYSALDSKIKGAQLQYEAIIETNVERTATQTGTAKVSKNGKENKIITVSATPKAKEDESTLGETTYEPTTTNSLVTLAVRDGKLYATYAEAAEATE